MNTTPFNIHAPNSYGIGLYLNVIPEIKESGTEFQVFLDNDLLIIVSQSEAGEWEWVAGDDPGEVDFGFITGQIESNL
jgi:hypothetical protein